MRHDDLSHEPFRCRHGLRERTFARGRLRVELGKDVFLSRRRARIGEVDVRSEVCQTAAQLDLETGQDLMTLMRSKSLGQYTSALPGWNAFSKTPRRLEPTFRWEN